MEQQIVAREDFERYLDLGDVLKRLGGNRAILVTLLKKFIAGKEEERLKEALANFPESRQEAKDAAHTIKGLAANLSLIGLREAALNLETALKSGGEPGDLPQAVYDAYAKTSNVIQSMLDAGEI